MAQAQVQVAWVLVRDDGQVGEWEHDSVLVFQTEREAKKFTKRVIGRTPLRGRYTPRPLVGRLLARVQRRPLAVALDNGDDTVSYAVVFDAPCPATAFATARRAVRAAVGGETDQTSIRREPAEREMPKLPTSWLGTDEERYTERNAPRFRSAVAGREWRVYANPSVGTINVDAHLLGRFAERRVDVMDGMRALCVLSRNMMPKVEPHQQEYHFRSLSTPNPLDGLTVHFAWVDGEVYVSETEFVSY